LKVVLQRVSRAAVRIDGEVVGQIGKGLLLLVGFRVGDGEPELQWMVEKLLGLRVFSDSEGKMNLDLSQVEGGVLVVSQFTLYGDTRKGRRPSFIGAAPPEVAIPLYGEFLSRIRAAAPGPVESGEFGAMMDVELVNDGPVTLVLER
jgi:D-tyrosyl-tRNA(Tyr) deacylase